mgnify:CR=1 FL=1
MIGTVSACSRKNNESEVIFITTACVHLFISYSSSSHYILMIFLRYYGRYFRYCLLFCIIDEGGHEHALVQIKCRMPPFIGKIYTFVLVNDAR